MKTEPEVIGKITYPDEIHVRRGGKSVFIRYAAGYFHMSSVVGGRGVSCNRFTFDELFNALNKKTLKIEPEGGK